MITHRLRLALQLVVVALAAIAALADVPASFVEAWYATALYPAIQRLVTATSNLIPFAILDVVAIAALVTLAVLGVRAIRTAWRTRRATPVVRVAWQMAVAAAALYLVFLVLWGFNYRRVPMADRLVLDEAAPSGEAVLALGLEAVSRLNALHDEAHRLGWGNEPWQDDGMRGAFARVQQLFAEAPLAVPGRLKASLLGPYFRWTSVDGMVNPFGLEVLGNPDLLPFERPFVAAHEWAHLAGYAHEAEANFVGWLACLQAGVPAQYSGWLYLYWQVNGELGADGRALLAEAMDEGPRSDVNAVASRIRAGQLPWLRTAAWSTYDQYLRANRVGDGVRSYGAVLTLILRARFDETWLPARRDVF